MDLKFASLADIAEELRTRSVAHALITAHYDDGGKLVTDHSFSCNGPELVLMGRMINAYIAAPDQMHLREKCEELSMTGFLKAVTNGPLPFCPGYFDQNF